MAAIFFSTTKLILFSSLIAMVFLSLTETISAAASTKTQNRRFVIKLIHRDSIFSPFYNPNATIEDRTRQVEESSIARLGYLARTTSMARTNDVRGHIIADDIGTTFLVTLSIGDPPVQQMLAMDTGSYLLWVQCTPCKTCFKQYSPMFDPSKSSTYRYQTCNSCPKTCDPFNHCNFKYGYADSTYVSGILGYETFSDFFTSDEGITSVPSLLFGCVYDSKASNGQLSGILGLGPSSVLMSQLIPKFSYCIGSINDPKYPYNVLILWDEAIIQGDSTPLQPLGSFYYLTMQNISVGGKVLNIDPKFFQKDSKGRGGVIIDSGSTYSYLVQGAYEPLSNEVTNLLDNKLRRIRDPKDASNVCYLGDIRRDLTGFPVVTFLLAGGAQFDLDTGSFFRQITSDIFCIAVRLSIPTLNGLNLIGVMAQQNYNVAYDLHTEKLTIQRIDCQLLQS